MSRVCARCLGAGYVCTQRTGWKEQDCTRCDGTGETFRNDQGAAIEAAMEGVMRKKEAVGHAKRLAMELMAHCASYDIAAIIMIAGDDGIVSIDVNLEEVTGPTTTGAAIAVAWAKLAASIEDSGERLEERVGAGVSNG